MSARVVGEVRRALAEWLREVIYYTVTHAEHARRRTVMPMDVVLALKVTGSTLYGFGG